MGSALLEVTRGTSGQQKALYRILKRNGRIYLVVFDGTAGFAAVSFRPASLISSRLRRRNLAVRLLPDRLYPMHCSLVHNSNDGIGNELRWQVQLQWESKVT